AAMCEFAQAGNFVYHGHAGQQLLPGVEHVLKVRLIAPQERRIRTAMEERGISHEAAAKHIQKIDDERYHRMRDLFDVDWRDPALYDLILNLEHMSIETAAEAVVSLVQQSDFQPTAESTRRSRTWPPPAASRPPWLFTQRPAMCPWTCKPTGA